MSKVTIIESSLIHNLQFEIMHNGLTYSVQNGSDTFQTGKNYSPLELAQGNDLACEAIMLEADKHYHCNKSSYVDALILDSKYSKQGFKNNLDRINLCGWWELSNAFEIGVKGADLGNKLLFVNTKDQALKMAKNMAKVNNKDTDQAFALESGKITDHIHITTIETSKRSAAKILMCSGMKRELFTLQDEAPDQAFTDCDFFKWLDKNKITDHNSILTRERYLKEIGFKMAFHKLSEKAVNSLSWILQYHFDQRVKPTLEKQAGI